MVVAMALMRAMKMSIHYVVGMVAVRDSFMATAGGVLM